MIRLLFLLLIFLVAAKPSLGQVPTPSNQIPDVEPGIRPSLKPNPAGLILKPTGAPPVFEKREVAIIAGPLSMETVVLKKIDDPRPCVKRACSKHALLLDSNFLRNFFPHPWEKWMEANEVNFKTSIILNLDNRVRPRTPITGRKLGIRITLTW